MAIDQYGQTYHGLKNPRKDLCHRLGCKSAVKMYQDKKDGTTCHAGYVIAGLWLTLYEVVPYAARKIKAIQSTAEHSSLRKDYNMQQQSP